MKSILKPLMIASIMLLLAGGQAVQSQGIQTLISGNVRHGGFGGPVVKFGSIDEELAVWVGGRGGWIIKIDNAHSISLGGGGYGLVTDHLMPIQQNLSSNTELASIGYGGIEVEYAHKPNQVLHWSVSSLIGAGGITIRDKHYETFSTDEASAFFAFEPGFHAVVNMTTYFRIGLGVSYLFTNGIEKGGLSDSDISGPKAQISLRFGSF
ncbi:hypothetical protein QLX67_09765 [Balneolaceae bacterium ANBcel3]|nr:hypothetical protein [Balneolaceae bacterium ANBcel3]